MQETLNFGMGHKQALRKILQEMESRPTTNYFEELRGTVDGCTVTLYESGKVSIQGANAAGVKKRLLEKMGLAPELVIGIDEVGRGERMGPMVITGVLADTNGLRELRDSKKTADIAAKEKITSEKMLASVSVTINANMIDLARNRGMDLNEIESRAVEKISEILSGLDGGAKIIADGAPLKTINPKIKFLPKADDIEPVVGAASVIAKHLRNNSSDNGERMTWKKKADSKTGDYSRESKYSK